MKTEKDIAIAIGGFIALQGSKDLGFIERKMALRQMDLLLWVMDYPSDYKIVFDKVVKLGMDPEEILKHLADAKVETSAIMDNLRSLLEGLKRDSGSDSHAE